MLSTDSDAEGHSRCVDDENAGVSSLLGGFHTFSVPGKERINALFSSHECIC